MQSAYLYVEETVPSTTPSAQVNIDKQMKFCGDFLRTLSQHAMAIMITNVNPIET